MGDNRPEVVERVTLFKYVSSGFLISNGKLFITALHSIWCCIQSHTALRLMRYCLGNTTLHFNSPPSGNIRGLIKVEKRNNIPPNPTAITLNYAKLWTCNSALRLRINVRLPPLRWYILNCLSLPTHALTVWEIYNLLNGVITFLCFPLPRFPFVFRK